MARDDKLLVQLAVRIPRTLLRELKLLSVKSGSSLADIVGAAIEEKLRAEGSLPGDPVTPPSLRRRRARQTTSMA